MILLAFCIVIPNSATSVKIAQYLPVFFDFDNYSAKASIFSASRVISFGAMEIIIDGYNVIGSDTGLTGNLEYKRNSLVQQLASYHKNKGYGVTVVFDGWRSGSIDEVEQKREGICIVYSRLGEGG